MSFIEHFVHAALHAGMHEMHRLYGHPHSHAEKSKGFILVNQEFYDVTKVALKYIREDKLIPQDIYNYFPNEIENLCSRKGKYHLFAECKNKPDYLKKIKCIWGSTYYNYSAVSKYHSP